MSTLADWSLSRVLLVSGAWVLLCVLAIAVWLWLQFRGAWVETGSGGMGAVSFGINVLFLFGPPVMLMLVWLIARWTHS